MNTSNELTIVIPSKNEEKLLPGLLDSLLRQDYSLLPTTRVYLADAGSTDHTLLAAADYSLKLRLKVIPGGLPSVGRNAGARLANSKYLLFLDADVEIRDTTLLRRAVNLMKERQLHCLTTDILCSHGAPADHLLYLLNNVAQRGSRFTRPFATGMFMMVEKARFDELGGFDERALYAEDYQFTRQIDRRRFRVVGGGIRSTNRRFKKMGHGRIVRMFLKTAWNGRSSEHYRNSLHQAYWETR